jgi:ribose 5-phosphate isomerase A
MKDVSLNADAKRLAGEAAAELVRSGMVVGLGTGSTVAWTIRWLGARIEAEGLDFLGVPTSFQAESLAIECGINLTTLNQHPVLDLAIDGADQVDADLFAIKGGGAAHTREKVVACSARRFVIVADESKYAKKLTWPVPVEVLPFAYRPAERWLRALGGEPVLRLGRKKDGPVITDNGNFVLDVNFGTIEQPAALASKMNAVAGVVGHGIFESVDELYLAGMGGGIKRIKRD